MVSSTCVYDQLIESSYFYFYRYFTSELELLIHHFLLCGWHFTLTSVSALNTFPKNFRLKKNSKLENKTKYFFRSIYLEGHCIEPITIGPHPNTWLFSLHSARYRHTLSLTPTLSIFSSVGQLLGVVVVTIRSRMKWSVFND